MAETYIYEPIDLCALYEPLFFPPDDFLEELHNPFHSNIRRLIGNTWFIVETVCDGKEALAGKVKRLMFSDKEGIDR